MEGSIVNQIEISGFTNEKDSEKFRKKIKSLKSIFNLTKINKTLNFIAEEASWKNKEDFSLIFLFLTEDSAPVEIVKKLAELFPALEIKHLIISPSGSGLLKYLIYSEGKLLKNQEIEGSLSNMLGDLIQGGFK